MGKLAHSQTIYVLNNDTLTCLSEKELDIVINSFVDRDMCREAFDTLSVGYDACMSANVQLEGINAILTNDLEISKVISRSLDAENIEIEKQLKKEIRKRKFNSALLWVASGISAALLILYVFK